jgi:hypothetical protein
MRNRSGELQFKANPGKVFTSAIDHEKILHTKGLVEWLKV